MEPGEDIVRFAKENNVDEIIIGVRSRSKVGKLLFGSTSQVVILEAYCPVVTVK
jgi:nucleotide-binding universal stress UspA family protein